MKNYKAIIEKLKNERYPDAKAIFWAGSTANNQATSSSDIDLIIVFEELDHAYREAFIYEDTPIDAFIHDPSTLNYFFENIEAKDGRPALIQMILKSHEVLGVNDFSISIKELAQKALEAGPKKWTKEEIDKERFLITDILDDIKSPKTKDEQLVSAIHLFEPLIQFHFRSQGKWSSSGKSLIRLLQNDNPILASKYIACFNLLFQSGQTEALESVVKEILDPFGGLLWNGSRSDAPKEWRIKRKALSNNIFICEPDDLEISNIINDGLKEYNQTKIGPYEIIPFNIYAIDTQEKVIAGIKGEFINQLVRVNLVWVDENNRNKGIGTKLFEALEKYAKEHNYKIIQLFTTDFQAPGFYEKLGFTCMAKVDRVFVGGKIDYLMRKVL